MRIALLQLNAGDDPAENLTATKHYLSQAVDLGADFVLTPEVTNIVSLDRKHQARVLHRETEDPTLAALCEHARQNSLWLSIGSLALKAEDDDRFANRSFLVAPDGSVVARYDKIHMFDVEISAQESYRESSGYRPGAQATLVATDIGSIGLTICYDLRFPALYRSLAQAGAQIITVPSAFSPASGAAHWQTLLRARAIETGSFVLAAAQTGTHPSSTSRSRTTYGHSLVVGPWGDVLADAGTDPGILIADIDLTDVTAAREKIPSLRHDRPYKIRR